MSVASILATEVVRPLSRREYDELVGFGAFSDERVELIRGIIVSMSPLNPPHNEAVYRADVRLKKALDGRARVNVQLSFAASDDSEPEPDIAVVEDRSYAKSHPGEAFLIVEVAHTSQHRDLEIKPVIYASSKVQEYWVVDIKRREVVVHRHSDGAAWGLVQHISESESVSPVAFPDVSIKVSDLLP